MKIGIVYRQNGPAKEIDNSVLSTGAECINLSQVKSYAIEYDCNNKILDKYVDDGMVKPEYVKKIMEQGYEQSNINEVMKDIDALVFSGGCDISPTFFSRNTKRANNNEKIVPERDVSDFLCMKYALDNNIPTLCICRGMQVLAIVSGCDLIQHIDDYYLRNGYKYEYTHRNCTVDPKIYMQHDIEIVDANSIIGKIFGNKIEQNYSFHHQAVAPFTNIDNLKVTGVYNDNKVKIIEAIERTDKDYFIGIQFHPERGIESNNIVQLEDCKKIFKSLYNEVERRKHLL